MSGINQSVVLNVCRLVARFADDIGNHKAISGSGFWLLDGNDDIYVTNKHNVDPTIVFGDDTDLKIDSLEIELRLFQGNTPTSSTKFFEAINVPQCIKSAPSADVAIIRNPTYKNQTIQYRHGRVLKVGDLADQHFIEDKVQIMDVASFIGFPGKGMSRWWDQAWNLGIARSVNIASLPGVPFTHSDIKTKDITLVSGLSFSGSSGSVVILHEKSIKPGAGLVNPSYVPPKILGIMSGHWPEPGTTPAMLSHSGLSYFTRSTSIVNLL